MPTASDYECARRRDQEAFDAEQATKAIASEVESCAQAVADDCGRDWNDCGAYERESFRDEARRILGYAL